jgi:hypothetical protein
MNPSAFFLVAKSNILIATQPVTKSPNAPIECAAKFIHLMKLSLQDIMQYRTFVRFTTLPPFLALYAVFVRGLERLPRASFRFHLAVDTLP